MKDSNNNPELDKLWKKSWMKWLFIFVVFSNVLVGIFNTLLGHYSVGPLITLGILLILYPTIKKQWYAKHANF